MTRSASLWAGICLAAFLVLGAIWLVLHNPSIDGTSRGDGYECLAPYDIVLNGADSAGRGELPPDANRIDKKCDSAAHRQFKAGVGIGLVALVIGAGAAVLTVRRSPR